MFHVRLILMVTTKQNAIADWQKIKGTESTHSATENQITKEGSRGGIKNKGNTKQPDNKMTLVSSYQLVITLNVNGLNMPTENQSGWMDKKQDLTKYCLHNTHFCFKEAHRFKVKR